MNRTSIFLVLSIAAFPITVKAQEKNLPSFKNGAGQDAASAQKADTKNLAKLVQLVLDSGEDFEFADGFAQAVALEEPRPAKFAHADNIKSGDKVDGRECNIVYRTDDTGKHAICILLSRAKWSKTEMHDKYYRVSLDGTLEKATALYAKRGPDGNGLEEGRSRSEEDVTSAETKKEFRAELDYWVKHWLKKHPKGVTKTEAPAAAPATSPAP